MKHQEHQKDTGAWIMLVWLAFAVSVGLAGLGIWNLPAEDWQKGYMAMGMLFTLGSTFSLVKTTRDNRFRRVDTGAWVFQVWAAFAISLTMTAMGLWNIKVEAWVQGYGAIALIFMMMMAFTLAKTVRDNNPNEILDTLDSNADGFLTRDEVKPHAKLSQGFAAADKNSDGKLSRDEVQAYLKAGNRAQEVAKAA